MSLMFYWFIILLVIYQVGILRSSLQVKATHQPLSPQIIVKNVPIDKIREWQLRYHIVVWILVVINTVVLWGINVLGPVPHVFTCWIKGDDIVLR